MRPDDDDEPADRPTVGGGEKIPAVGAIVLYHDPRGGQVWPAIVVRHRTDGALDLNVFTVQGAFAAHGVGRHPGEFGHWGPRPEEESP